MADLHKALNFNVLVQADGTNKSLDLSFATDPISYSSPDGLTVDSALGAISNVSYNSVTHVLSLDFANTGTDDTLYLLSGVAIY